MVDVDCERMKLQREALRMRPRNSDDGQSWQKSALYGNLTPDTSQRGIYSLNIDDRNTDHGKSDHLNNLIGSCTYGN